MPNYNHYYIYFLYFLIFHQFMSGNALFVSKNNLVIRKVKCLVLLYYLLNLKCVWWTHDNKLWLRCFRTRLSLYVLSYFLCLLVFLLLLFFIFLVVSTCIMIMKLHISFIPWKFRLSNSNMLCKTFLFVCLLNFQSL